MRFLPSRANALFEFDEIASLAVAIEVFLPQRIARHAQGFEPVARPFDETARSKRAEIRHGCARLRLCYDAHCCHARRPVRGTADYTAKPHPDHKRRPRPIGNGVRAWIG